MSSGGRVTRVRKRTGRVSLRERNALIPPPEEEVTLRWKEIERGEEEAIQDIVRGALLMPGYLAGGALRDWILGRRGQIKDFDIFFIGENPPDLPDKFGNITFLPKEAVVNMRPEVRKLIKYYDANIDIVCVDCRGIRELVRTFDASVCQVWVEWLGLTPYVYCTSDFLDYIRKGVWYYYVDIPTSNHLWRLVGKFGQFIPKYRGEFEPICLGTLNKVLQDRVDYENL